MAARSCLVISIACLLSSVLSDVVLNVASFFASLHSSGGSRAAATSKMERFVIIVNGFQPLTIITKRSIIDVAAGLDSPLHSIDRISTVTFPIQLWRSVTNPPLLPVNARSMLYFTLQTHSCGKRVSSLPNVNKTVSRNSRLVNENLSSFNFKDDNHI